MPRHNRLDHFKRVGNGQSIGRLVLAAALIVGGMDLFSQKSGKATLIDSGYIVASGVLMVLAQAVF